MPPYPPNDDMPKATWREIAWMVRVILEILAGPLVIIVGTLLLFFALFYALTTNALLAVIPVGLMGLGLAYLARRAKKDEAEALREIEAGRVPRSSGRRPPSGY